MRSFTCDICGQLLVFENSQCVQCGTALGFDVASRRVIPVPDDGSLVGCANAMLAGCTWLVPAAEGGLCFACRFTRTRPSDGDRPGLEAFARTEAAKRRLLYQLLDLGLPLEPLDAAPGRGLAFDLLSSRWAPVTTGHADGVVTIDLAEGHDAHREAMRVELAEPYRTLLGHLRHEVGHYYWMVLVQGNGLVEVPAGAVAEFRSRFGDEREDYAQALQRHYAQGPAVSWGEQHVSAYATAHPWEDWAETFAHYLHILDTLQTAAGYGLIVTGPPAPVGAGPADSQGLIAVPSEVQSTEVVEQGIGPVIATWLPLTYALNAVNRSMGKDDLYPFLLTPTVIEKLDFVHRLVLAAAGRDRRAAA